MDTPINPQPAPANSLGGVLIIDDEESVRTVLARMVTRLGYTVQEADGGPSGLAVLRATGDDLVALLVDMTMPHMSGIEVARAALALRPGLPIVLMSGHPSEELVRAHGLSGAVRFLQKPFSYAMVRDLLS
jgi:CheY-like chemotaxis protein